MLGKSIFYQNNLKVDLSGQYYTGIMSQLRLITLKLGLIKEKEQSNHKHAQ